MTADIKLPEWPQADNFAFECVDGDVIFDRESYERARADAAMARLRVAVEAMKQAQVDVRNLDRHYGDTADDIKMALAAIGDLPTLPGEGA